MKWELGRQGTGYRKLKLLTGKSFDCYLIDYPPGTHIPIHVDPVPGFCHFRINLLLLGEDKFIGETILSFGKVKFFRPDIMPHSVEEVSTRRIVLSIGWVRR